ncbi:MAG: D-2-hydroxyacid dehydrogenase [Verrucomicrobiales bacterium]|nr:D-2-hydroxyacid dehydrogenase [Verrucomicrobiales bacterium]
MRIVVLDGFTANPGDLSWEAFERLGACTIHPRSSPEEIVERASGAEVVLTNKVPIDAAAIERLPDLRYIGVTATGFNNVDVVAARRRGIPVTNVPEYGTATVAQAVFALLLELTNRAGHHAATVREGRWSRSRDFCYWDGSLVELAGLTLGIVGYGRIGSAVGRIGRTFGMRVLACRRAGSIDAGEAEAASLDTVFRESDVVSLHCPLTPETRGLVDAARIASMKPGAFLINTSRGLLVNEADLAEALNAGRIAGAGLDVLSVEPPSASHPLLGARNCVVTPHIAWATRAARERLLRVAAENVAAFLAGRPRNVVNA